MRARASAVALLVRVAAAAAAADDAPLPEARELVERLIANQEAVDALVEQYTFKMRETELKAERGEGEKRYRKEHEKLWQVYPSREVELQRLLERDGVALSAAEEAKEDRRLEKLVREHGEREAKRRARGQEEDRDGDEVRIRDLLRASLLRTVGRERFRDRDCLMIDVRPNPGYRGRTRAEKLAMHLEGRLWVDEEDLQIVRAEARLEKIKKGGGLVATLKEATLVFEQQRVGGEVWLPTLFTAEYRGRVLLFKGFDGRATAEFFDYQKYGAEVGVTYGQPASDGAAR